jgi:hypothetical protein
MVKGIAKALASVLRQPSQLVGVVIPNPGSNDDGSDAAAILPNDF